MLKPLTLRMPNHVLPSPPYWYKEKKTFEVSEYTTCLGEKIADLKVGYETYGNLNALKDNAILICHYFTGSSNAAGKYKESDLEPGYWNSIIGPDKAIDTNKFFVISVDSLCNLCVRDPNVVTTGPASINPATQKKYGFSFPIVGIDDFAKIQKAVVQSFGIQKLYAAVGPSLGSMQVMQWAGSYPEMVDRVIAVIGGGLDSPSYLAAMVDLWAAPIYLDPAWNGGDYSAENFPLEGLKQSLKAMTITCLSPDWAKMIGGSEFSGGNPREEFSAQYYVQQALDEVALARLKLMDPNHFLYLVKAVQNFSVRSQVSKMKSRFLFISAESDLILLPQYAIDTCRELKARGLDAEYFEIEGNGGHLDGLYAIGLASQVIAKFLAR